jgi:hypothetical protein
MVVGFFRLRTGSGRSWRPVAGNCRLTFPCVLVSLPDEPDIAVRKTIFKGCFVFVLMALLAGGGLLYFLNKTPSSGDSD